MRLPPSKSLLTSALPQSAPSAMYPNSPFGEQIPFKSCQYITHDSDVKTGIQPHAKFANGCDRANGLCAEGDVTMDPRLIEGSAMLFANGTFDARPDEYNDILNPTFASATSVLQHDVSPACYVPESLAATKQAASCIETLSGRSKGLLTIRARMKRPGKGSAAACLSLLWMLILRAYSHRRMRAPKASHSVIGDSPQCHSCPESLPTWTRSYASNTSDWRKVAHEIANYSAP